MKKRGLAFTTIVQGILAIVALLVFVNVVGTMFGKGSQSILGINTDKINTELAERFELDKTEFKVPGDSMLGLTYGLNSLAFLDYHNQWKTVGKGKTGIKISGAALVDTPALQGKSSEPASAVIQAKPPETPPVVSVEKAFGQTSVSSIPYGLKKLEIKKEDDKEKIYMKFTLAVLDCWRRFEDSSRLNQNCNELIIDNDVQWNSIKLSEISNWVEAHDCYTGQWLCTGDDKLNVELDKIYRNKELATQLTGIADDVFGTISNIRVVTASSEISKGGRYVVCGNNAGVNEVFITDNWEKQCDTRDDVLGNNKYSYVVKDFELPQDYREIAEKHNVESWLDSHGDPKYVVYYEAFPEGEDEAWQMSTMSVMIKSIATAAVLGATFDVVTFGMGKGWGKLTAKYVFFKTIGKTAKAGANAAVKGVKLFSEGVVLGVRAIYKALSKDAAEQVTKKTIQNAMLVSIRLSDGWLKYFEKELGSEAEERAAQKLAQSIANKLAHGKKFYLDANGKLTQEGIERLQKALGEEITELGLEKIGKKGVTEIVEATIKGAGSKFDDKFIADAIKAANTKVFLTGVLKQSDDIAFDIIHKRLSATSTTILKNMDDATRRAVIEDHKLLINRHLWDKAAGSLTWKEQFAAVSDAEARELAEKFARSLPDDVGGEYGNLLLAGTKKFFWGDNTVLPKKRYMAAVLLAIWYSYEQNKMEKFRNVGENSLALRTPYTNTVIYDEADIPAELRRLPMQIPDAQKDTFVSKRKKFLEDYGTEGTGLLPEVSGYYLQLIRDRLPFWPDQDPQRFFLASPCKADLYLHVDQCECYGKEDPEDGVFAYNKAYPGQGVEAVPSYGLDMLYTVDNGMPVRKCDAPSWYSSETLWSTVYRPKCIKINPIIETGYNNGYNFCYAGSHQVADSLQLALTATEIGVSAWAWIGAGAACIGGTIASAPVGGIGALGCPAAFAIAATTSAVTAGAVEGLKGSIEEKFKKWPLHGSGT